MSSLGGSARPWARRPCASHPPAPRGLGFSSVCSSSVRPWPCRSLYYMWIIQKSVLYVDHSEVSVICGSFKSLCYMWIIQKSVSYVDHSEVCVIYGSFMPSGTLFQDLVSERLDLNEWETLWRIRGVEGQEIWALSRFPAFVCPWASMKPLCFRFLMFKISILCSAIPRVCFSASIDIYDPSFHHIGIKKLLWGSQKNLFAWYMCGHDTWNKTWSQFKRGVLHIPHRRNELP